MIRRRGESHILPSAEVRNSLILKIPLKAD